MKTAPHTSFTGAFQLSTACFLACVAAPYFRQNEAYEFYLKFEVRAGSGDNGGQ
jgi:hypothetical protein